MNRLMEEKCPLSMGRMILLFLNYFIGYNLLYPLLMVTMTKWIDPLATRIPQWMQLMMYVWMILVSVVLSFPLLKEGIIGIKRNWKRLIPSMLLLLILYYICSFAVNLVVIMLSGTTTSVNQGEIIEAVAIHPYLMMFSTLVYAPIVEEMLFRGVFYRALRSRMRVLPSALISALLFGFIHVMYSIFTGNFSDVIFLLSYSVIGFFMAMAYEISESIYGSMFFHCLNNAIAFFALLG